MKGYDSNVFVLLGDGELHEGQIWEAALSAAHHNMSNLLAIVDRNDHSSRQAGQAPGGDRGYRRDQRVGGNGGAVQEPQQ